MSVIPGVSGVTSMLARDSLHSSLLHTCLGVEVAYRRYEYGDHVPQVLVLAGPRDVHLLGGHPGVEAGAGQHHPVAGLVGVHGLILGKIMEICFINTAYPSQIRLILASYMKPKSRSHPINLC